MWHVALESWQWIHQVAAPCNVIRGSGITCCWIRPVAAPWNVTRSSGIMTLNSPGGSTLQCGRCMALGWQAIEFAQTSAILEFYIWFRFWSHHRSRHVIMHQSAKCYPNRTTLSRKMTSCRFSKWRISAIALNCLVFEKIAFLQFGDRQTNRRTDGHAYCVKPLSLSRAAA